MRDNFRPLLIVELYKPGLDLTDGAWLSGRVLVSDVVRRPSFSPRATMVAAMAPKASQRAPRQWRLGGLRLGKRRNKKGYANSGQRSAVKRRGSCGGGTRAANALRRISSRMSSIAGSLVDKI
jgi:hypothetical protein